MTEINTLSTAIMEKISELRASPLDHRCRNCGRLLFRARLMPGSHIKIRCARCNSMQVLDTLESLDIKE